MPDRPSDQPEQSDQPDPAVPVNRAQRRAAGKNAAARAARSRGAAQHIGPAHPGAQGRRVNPIRRTG